MWAIVSFIGIGMGIGIMIYSTIYYIFNKNKIMKSLFYKENVKPKQHKGYIPDDINKKDDK